MHRRFQSVCGGISLLCVLFAICLDCANAQLAAPRVSSSRTAPNNLPAHVEELISTLDFPSGQQAVVVPLERGQRFLLCPSVRINGRDIGRFLIDTGGNVSAIDARIAGQMGLAVLDGAPDPVGSTPSLFRKIDSISVEGVSISNHFIAAMDLSKFSSDFSVPVAGILGGDFFGKLPFTIDYSAPSLTLYAPHAFCPPSAAKVFDLSLKDRQSAANRYVAANPHAGTPALEATVDKVKCGVCLDTGADVEICLLPAFTSAHPKVIEQKEMPREIKMIVPAVTWYPAHVQEIVLFDHAFSHPRQAFAGAPATNNATGSNITIGDGDDGIAGADLLQHFRLTFNYSSRRVWAEWQPAATTKTRLSTGLNPNASDLSGWTPLIRAAADGDEDAVEALLASGAKANACDVQGRSALYFAAANGDEAIARSLIRACRREDIDIANRNGVTPLMAAIESQNAKVVALLLDAGADVKRADAKGRSLAHYAAMQGNATIIESLARRGAALDVRDAEHVVPLEAAAAVGSVENFDALLKSGASIRKAQAGITSIFFHAVMSGKSAMIMHVLHDLSEKPSIDARGPNGITPLMLAAELGKVDSVAALVDSGADVRATAHGLQFGTPLHFAALCDEPEVIRLLLKYGAPLEARTMPQGRTPLMIAADTGHIHALRAMLDAGARIDLVDNGGASPLYFAVKNGHIDEVQELLKRGANPEATADGGVRPLHLACDRGYPQIVRLLLEHGADRLAKTTDGLTALEIAARAGHEDIVTLLQTAQPSR